MTQYEQQEARTTGVFYAENRSAIRWPYYIHFAVWLVVLVAGIWMTSVNPSMSFVMAAGFIGVLFTVALAVKNWPTGIRVSADGIRIGGVGLHPRPARKNLPWADWQRRHVFFCPWEGVRRVAVITDKAGLQETRKLNTRDRIRIGALTGPFTRAALLIEIDPDRVIRPEFRESDTKQQFWRYSHLAEVEPSPVWYVPTRRPDALRAVLAQHVAAFGGKPDPYLPAHFQLLFERAGVTG